MRSTTSVTTESWRRSERQGRSGRRALLAIACLLLAPVAANATLFGDQVYLNVTIVDPPDLLVFDGNTIVADGPVDFTFGDIALGADDLPKYVFDVDFTGPDGLTVVITATRNTAFDDINGQFRSFEFTGLNSIGAPRVITNATLTGITGTDPDKWQGATITEFGSDFFTFETGGWNSSDIVQGDTIIATIQLTVQDLAPLPQTYEYDALGRVTRVNYRDGDFVAYTYDRAGNIVQRTVPEPAFGAILLAGSGLLTGLERSRRRRHGRRREGEARARRSGWIAALVALLLIAPSFALAQGAGPFEDRPGWRESVRERLAEQEYEVSWQHARLRKAAEAWQAPNRAQNFRTHFLDEGIRVTPREETEDPWEIGLSFLSYGRGDQVRAAERGTPRADGKRVRYQRGEIIEWFVNEREGLEQGFTLNAPPRRGRGLAGRALGAKAAFTGQGTAPVYVALRVDGDARPDLTADGQAIDFVRTGSPFPIAHYDHLEVVDADGRVLDSWMEIFRDDAGHGIRLLFDDSDAAYPVVIDPLLTTPGWSVTGNQASEGLGFSVAGAGDVNGDGFDDVLVGAPWYDEGVVNSGRAYLFIGGPTGLSSVPTWFGIGEAPLGTRAAGPANSRFGYTVAAAGDVDADGFDDFMVARVPSDNNPIPGQVFLYRGSPSGPDNVANWTLEGRNTGRLGFSIARAGNLNRDRDDPPAAQDPYDDIVIGEPGDPRSDIANNLGRVYVFYGQDAEASGELLLGGGQRCVVAASGAAPGVSCPGGGLQLGVPVPVAWSDPNTEQDFGEVVAAAGDMNCDGVDDLALGQPRFDGQDRGRVLIYLSESPAGINGVTPIDIRGVNQTNRPNFDLEFGTALVAAGSAGRENGCGDLLVGAPGRDPRFIDGDDVEGENHGAVYVIQGDPSPPFETLDLAVGPVDRGTFGESLANLGDVDGDSIDDFLIGAPGEPNYAATAGRAYLWLGPDEGALEDWPEKAFTVWRLDGAEDGDFLGSSVAGAGDVDGDSFGDALVGSPTARVPRSNQWDFPLSGPTGAGSAFLFYGRLPDMLDDLLGSGVTVVEDGFFAWAGDDEDTVDDGSLWSPAVGRGPVPDSIILSTGLAQDTGTGATDLGIAGLRDEVFAGLILQKPADPTIKTLRFTTQYLSADPDAPRATAAIDYKYNPSSLVNISDDLALETPIALAGNGEAHAPISHAIDVSDPNIVEIGLELTVEEADAGAADTAIVLSNVYFSDLPMPDYLSDELAPSDPRDTLVMGAADGRIDFVVNPRPSDVSASAGPFRYGLTLFDVPGKRQPFQLSLSYDSERTREDQLGPKWSHSLASTAIISDDDDSDGCPDSAFVFLGAGRTEVFDGAPGVGPDGCDYAPRYPGVFSEFRYVNATVGYEYETVDNFRSEFAPLAGTAPANTPVQLKRAVSEHPNGTAISWIYEAGTDQIDYAIDTRGAQYDFVYDTSFDPPRVESVTGPATQVSFGYNGAGFLSSVTDANGLVTTFTYDENGKLLTITDDDGVQFVENEYEAFAGGGVDQGGDRVVRQLNAVPGDLGRLTSYSGDAVDTTDREGGRKIDRYDVFGRVVESRLLLETGGPALEDCVRGDSECAIWSYAYDEDDLLVQQTDPRGAITDFEYDTRGNEICRTQDVTLEADPAVRTRSRTGALFDDERNNPIAEVVARVEDVEGNLPSCPLPGDVLIDVSNADWFITSYVYDGLDYLTSTTDASRVNTTSFTYDAEGLLDTVLHPDGETRSYTYDSLGHPQSVTDEAGEVTQFANDLMGRQTSTTDPRGNTLQVNYDAGGRVVSTIDPPLGFPLTTFEAYSYDAQGRQLTRTDGEGEVWTQSYTLTGQLETAADPLGNTTRYVYDEENRLISSTAPLGVLSPAPGDFETTQTYDAAGRRTSITNALGFTYEFTYDEAGNLETETSPDSVTGLPANTTTYTYDASGRRLSKQEPLDAVGFETRFGYDSRGLLVSQTEPHPTGGPGASVWSFGYTDTGQIESNVDPMGVAMTFTYDAMDRVDLETESFTGRVEDHDYDAVGRLSQVEVRVGSDVLTSTQAFYDAAGNASRITDPRSPDIDVVQYDYDALDRVTRERDALGNETQIVYEERGLVDTYTNARGQVIDYEYDAAGRQISVTSTDTTGTWTIREGDGIAGNTDANGRVTESASDSGAIFGVVRTFDELDRPITRTLDLPTTTPLSATVGAQYDAAGNLSAVVYSDGSRVEYGYDAQNRLASVRDYWDPLVPGDFRETTYAYDVAGRLATVSPPDGSQTSFEYDLAGRPTRIEDDHAAEGTIFRAEFTSDGAGRRIDLDPDTSVLPLAVDPFAETSATFTYDDANRLVGRDDGTNQDVFAYDADGNLTTGRLGEATSDLTFQYNALNQLVSVGLDDIRYDADGYRISRETGGTTVYYVYDVAGRLIEEIDAGGNTIARYVHGLGLISRESRQGPTQGDVSVYHYDSRGSTVALTNLAGQITDSYAYTPYGDVQAGTSNSTPNPFTYSGRDGVVDDGNGLYFMQARYYAPELMRFIQKDPVYQGEIERPQSLNRYAFVEGNPIERIDPVGEFGFSSFVGAVVGAVAGATVAIIEGEDLEGILESAGEGAAAGFIVGSTGGLGLVGGAIGGSLAAVQGNNVALGVGVGALTSLGGGLGVLGGALGGTAALLNGENSTLGVAAGGLAGAIGAGGLAGAAVGGASAAFNDRSVSIGIAVGAVSSISLGSAVFATFAGTAIETENLGLAAAETGGVLALGGIGHRLAPNGAGIGRAVGGKLLKGGGEGLGKLGGRALYENPAVLSRLAGRVAYASF